MRFNWPKYGFDWRDYTGALALIFALIYLALGRLMEVKLTREKRIQGLFYGTGLVFVVLMIPFQFGKEWLSLGWLVEGVMLWVYGLLKDERIFIKGGATISGLCLAAFILVDILGGWGYLFPYKYFALTLGSLLILGAYFNQRTLASIFQKRYKYATIVNLWLYLLYLITDLSFDLLSASLIGSPLSPYYLTQGLAIMLGGGGVFHLDSHPKYDHPVSLIFC